MYPDTAPLETPYPFVTYQQVGGVTPYTMAGKPDGSNARIQINAWAVTREQANTLMHAIETIAAADPFRAVPIGALVAEYNAATKGRGARQDFSFWFRP